MLILIAFAFLGGIVTILSPCILPILPIVLSGSVTGGKKRPLGVITGFIFGFTFFTLFLSAVVKATGISPDALRIVAVAVLSFFGLSLIVPALQTMTELWFSKLANKGPAGNSGEGFASGIPVGLSLGLVWTPCVGPILAAIIALAATSGIGPGAALITLAYATGTAVPLLAVTYGGRKLLTEHPALSANATLIRKIFGILMLVTALAIFFSWDRKFQAYVTEKFPAYGTGLTALEDNPLVRDRLKSLKGETATIGRLMESAYPDAPELIPGGEWINSPPLTVASLRGKVVLVDFWTYTCINCIRTLPYIRSWWEKYRDSGLVVIGVHTPEFEFEKSADNVRKAVKDFGITYPVMQDNGYATWRAYDNHYWPAKYLIDRNGKIRRTHFGEGEYDETETAIRGLLEETGAEVPGTVANPGYTVETRTPETYLGSARGDYSRITTTGTIRRTEEYANPEAGSTLSYRFDAMQVFLVMRPRSTANPARVRVTLDGNGPGNSAGEDVSDGIVTVGTDRLYKLIKLPRGGSHTLKLEFLDGNAELYAFTFG